MGGPWKANFCPTIQLPSSEEFWNRIPYHTLHSKNLNSVHIYPAEFQMHYSKGENANPPGCTRSLCREGVPSESEINHTGTIGREERTGGSKLQILHVGFFSLQTNCRSSYIMDLSSLSFHKRQESIIRHKSFSSLGQDLTAQPKNTLLPWTGFLFRFCHSKQHLCWPQKFIPSFLNKKD